MFAQRMASVAPSATLKVAAEAERLRRAGHKVVDFSAGEPDFPTPEHVKAAGKAAIDENFTKYTVVAGIPELRDAIAKRYKADYGVDIAPRLEVLKTSEAIPVAIPEDKSQPRATTNPMVVYALIAVGCYALIMTMVVIFGMLA